MRKPKTRLEELVIEKVKVDDWLEENGPKYLQLGLYGKAVDEETTAFVTLYHAHKATSSHLQMEIMANKISDKLYRNIEKLPQELWAI